VSVDPFDVDPATERALAELASYLRVGATQIAIRAPAGLGKTLLLRVIAKRLDGHLRVAYVPHPMLPPDEIGAWVLGLMDEQASGDPERALVSLARQLRENGSGLAVLLDDANSMPLPSVRRLSRLAAEARPALHLVFALPDDEQADAIIVAAGPGVEIVTLSAAMTASETAAYVQARLARAGVPEKIQAGFDEEVLRSIAEDSEGIPLLASQLAHEWMRRIAARREERIGQPVSAVPFEPGRGAGLGSALLGPSGPEVVDPWLTPAREPEEVAAELPAQEPLPTSGPESEVASAVAAPSRAPGPDASLAAFAQDQRSEVLGARRWSAERRVIIAATAVLSVGLALGLSFLAGRYSNPLVAGTEQEVLPSVEHEPAGLERVEVAPSQPEPPARVAAGEPADAGPGALPPVSSAPQSPVAPAASGGGEEPKPAGTLAERAETAIKPPAMRAPEVLEPEPASAPPPILVGVNATPWATIQVDGREVGITPLADLPLEPGEHRFRATLPDGRVVEREVLVTTLNRRVIFP
jgi:hypothetical protein